MKIYSRDELNDYNLSLTYDDISLVPTEISAIISRTEAKTNCKFLDLPFHLPVVSSPMDTVSGLRMVSTLTELGCLGIVNRFDSSLEAILTNPEVYSNVHAVAIGLNTTDEHLSKLAELGLIICIDTANANNKTVLSKCEEIKKRFGNKVIVGNIADGSSLRELVNAGADAVRIGIGGGSVCTTSVQTGIGIGQVSSLLDVYTAREKWNLSIELIADGGIKNPGDVGKAIAPGADAVMLGRMLAGTKETPGEIIKYDGQLWKKYRGSASFGVKMKNEFIEGEETMIPYTGAVENVVNGISDGVRSALSYMNCKNLDELRAKEKFVILSQSSYLERLPKK